MSLTSSRSPLTVAVVNDHEVIVRGIAAMLQPYSKILEVVELDVSVPVRRPVDIALYDTFTCPNLNVGGLEDLCKNDAVGKVAIYTWLLTQELAELAASWGVHAALHKSLKADSLVEALTHMPDHPGKVLAFAGDPDDAGFWPGQEMGLTAREGEVVALITSGLSNDEIADRTYLSINSVKSYIRSAYRTMGVTSRSKAVLWGIDHGMAPGRMRVPLSKPGSTELLDASVLSS